MNCDHEEPAQGRDDEGSEKRRLDLFIVSAADGLRSQSGCSRTQEIERREDEVENDATQGDAT